LGVGKVRALQAFDADGLEAWAVFSLPTGVFLQRIRHSDRLKLGMGGRVDRGDAEDMEICAYFPLSQMTWIIRTPPD